MTTILFVGGGSVGHISPSIAVWEAFKSAHPDAKAHFICSPRPDDIRFLDAQEVEYTILNAPRMGWDFPFKFPKAHTHSKKILDRIRPNIIFSKGGYVSIPMCVAAKNRGIPIVLHESDAVSGRANSFVGKWANHICWGFHVYDADDGDGNSYTGNPIRKEITQGSREKGLEITGFSGKRPIVLVMGGSQGAKAINEVILHNIMVLTSLYDIIHITGRNKLFPFSTAGYYGTEFAFEELPHLYACADIAVSRAGANSISELSANNLSLILVPLRSVGHDHQQHNAKAVEVEGGCTVLQEDDLSLSLLPTLDQISRTVDFAKVKSEKLPDVYDLHAADRIVTVLEATLASTNQAL